jgi:DNA-binding SARP family transcriptional activator
LPSPGRLEQRGEVSVQLLGSFGLRVGDRDLRVPLPAQRLLALLAVHERPLHRAYVSGRLWSETSQEHANGSLRTTLWRLQRLPCRTVEASTTHLSLLDGLPVDLRALRSSMRAALRGEPLSREDVERLVGADDFLLDSYEDWVLDERDRLRQELLLALESACVSLLRERRHAEAVMVAHAALAGDPLRESAVRVLVEACAATGNVAEALRRYERFRGELAQRLRLEPSHHLVRLIDAIAPGYAGVRHG